MRNAPRRHRFPIGASLDLEDLPGGIPWDGRIAYLDRDGVINDNRGDYVDSLDKFSLYPDVATSISSLRHAGYRVAIVTNQSPIGRGWWADDDLAVIHDQMVEDLLALDPHAAVDLILYAPQAPWDGSWARKPNPGMLQVATLLLNKCEGPSDERGLSLAQSHIHPASAMVGDRNTDMLAGMAFGVRTFFVQSDGLPSVITRILDVGDPGDDSNG